MRRLDTPEDVSAALTRLRETVSGPPTRVTQTLAAALREIASPVLVTDDSGRYIGATESACQLTGYQLNALLTKSVSDLTAPREASVHDRLWSAFSRTGEQSGSYDLIRQDGSVIHVTYQAFWDVVPGVHVAFIRAIS